MIALFKPFMPELPELQTILKSGKLAYGEYTKQFESELRKRFNTENLLVVSSYSVAISIILRAFGIKFDDEIVLSPMACLVSTLPYAEMGLKIKWCDIDNTTGTIDPASLRKSISNKTKAIVHNHYCGYLGYMDEVNAIAKERGIPVIDDGIEGFGSEYNGKMLGVCGSDATVFSLSAVRPLNTIEGGIIIFQDRDKYELALKIRDCGIDRVVFRDEIGEINPECDVSEVGYSAMMSNVNAYIGIEQLKHIDDLLNKQRTQAKKWDTFFQAKNDCRPLSIRSTLPNYWVYGILADDKRECILKFREQGLYASGVHINNNRYSVFGKSCILPGVNDFNNRFVALPCGWWMK